MESLARKILDLGSESAECRLRGCLASIFMPDANQYPHFLDVNICMLLSSAFSWDLHL